MKEKGVAVYEILPDGCLNGVYSNNNCDNKIFNEIARKSDDNAALEGDYVCVYIDLNNKVEKCKLRIDPNIKNRGAYRFIWSVKGETKFEGSGWKTRENQITVSYWPAE